MAEYIEREAVIHLTDILDEFLNDYERLYFVKKVKQLPAANVVEVVHGEWRGKPNPWIEKCFVCSICKEQIQLLGSMPKYCPNCGAKMDGKEQKE